MQRTSGGALTVKPEAQQLIDLMFRLLLSEHKTAQQIADVLNVKGCVTFGHGGAWDRQRVVAFFRDEALLKPPRAVTKKEFDDAQDKVSANRTRRSRRSSVESTEPINLFSSKLYCNYCGGGLRIQTRSGRTAVRCKDNTCGFEPLPYGVIELAVLFQYSVMLDADGVLEQWEELDARLERSAIDLRAESAGFKGLAERATASEFAEALTKRIEPIQVQLRALEAERERVQGIAASLKRLQGGHPSDWVATIPRQELAKVMGQAVKRVTVAGAWDVEPGPAVELWTSEEEAQYGDSDAVWRVRQMKVEFSVAHGGSAEHTVSGHELISATRLGPQ